MVKVNPNNHMYHYRAVHQQMITDKMKQGENHNKYHLPTLGLKKKNIINKDILKHHKNYKSCSTQVSWKNSNISEEIVTHAAAENSCVQWKQG